MLKFVTVLVLALALYGAWHLVQEIRGPALGANGLPKGVKSITCIEGCTPRGSTIVKPGVYNWTPEGGLVPAPQPNEE
jgi:hypothetical protein